jgi:hypothetical protein
MMILDQHSDRIKLLEAAAKTMFGDHGAKHLIEPPFEVESHLYQTIQAADWIATIVGRILSAKAEPSQYSDWAWAEQKFGSRIEAITTHSTFWRARSIPPSPPSPP